MAYRRSDKRRGGQLGKIAGPRAQAEPEGGYKKFKIEDLFQSACGDVDLQQRDLNGRGERLINSGVQNFGIKGRTDRPAKVFEAGTITIDFFGNAYYRPFRYKMATHNHVFSLSGPVIKNQSVGLYLVAQMSYLTKLFTFDNMGTWSKIKQLSISLPINSDGEIDYRYIERRMRHLEEECIRAIEAYFISAGLDKCTLSDTEIQVADSVEKNRISLRDVKIGSLFDIHPTKAYRLTNKDLFIAKGEVPIVSNTSVNNGIADRAGLMPTEKGNMITYSDTTTSEAIFYQPFDFVGYSHVQGLYPFSPEGWTENTLLYFVTLFRKSAAGRFDYANKFNRKIASEMIVSVPVTESGAIDFDAMEAYICALKKECISHLVLTTDSDKNRTEV